MKRLIAISTTLLFTFALSADEEVADYRQEVMGAIGSTMGSIGKILKGEVDRPDDLAPLAIALGELAKTVPDLFTEGSEGGDALPAIWEEPDDFAERVDAFLKASTAFREAASSGEMAKVGPAIQNLGRSCKGCHDSYRQ